ncbi:universal stress protein [Desulfitobacterium sp. Sab5]|uniref:universal stress protein n=1 Tax=Desulfitobacterium TaxID=36853 RepID=UPI003CF93FF8
MFKKILVPTDASEYSKRSLKIALEIARKFQAEVEVFHVTYTQKDYWGYTVTYGATITQEDLDKYGQLALDITVEGLNTDGVELKKVLEAGHPVTKILGEIEKQKIDLVVMGRHGYGAIAGSVFGSVSQRILQKATCPVLIAK